MQGVKVVPVLAARGTSEVVRGVRYVVGRDEGQGAAHWNSTFTRPDVDGGLNPRKSGAGRKVGTGLAVTPSEPRGWPANLLSTPSAAEGGGRRPGFTGG